MFTYGWRYAFHGGWYVTEIKKKKAESGYWITTDVKIDKDGDTIIVVYVGRKDDNEKK